MWARHPQVSLWGRPDFRLATAVMVSDSARKPSWIK